MRMFQRVTLLLVLLPLAACGGSKEATTDTSAMAPAMAGPMTAAATMAQMAGTWSMSSMLTGVEKPVPSTLKSNADGSTWTMSLEGRPDVPMTMSMVGDSLVGESAEYESVLRKGVMVTVRTATVMSNGMMMGSMVATYKSPTGEEKVNGTTTGTRAP